MRFDQHFLQEIKDRVPVSNICGRRVKLKKAGREWAGLSPFNKEKTPSFYVNDQKQAWFDFSSGRNGNVFDFVMATDGLTFPQAVEVLAAEAGLSIPRGFKAREASPELIAERAARQAEFDRQTADRSRQQDRKEKRIRELAHDIWKESKPISADDAAGLYLIRRGIGFAREFKTLRYHAGIEYRDGDDRARPSLHPALIAAVQAPDSRFLAIWRIFLSADGDKASVPRPKMGLGRYAEYGGCVRLGEPGPVGNTAEGIESGCGVYGLLRASQGVQATLSTSGMENYKPPPAVKRVLIWPDADVDKIKADVRTGKERTIQGGGYRSSDKLRARLEADGIPSAIQPTPQRGQDFLDVYNRTKSLLNDGEWDETTPRE